MSPPVGKADSNAHPTEPVPLDERSEPADPTSTPTERAAWRERLEASLNALDVRARLLVVLRDYEHRSWEEIARALDAPSAGAARRMYAQVLTQLEQEMDRRRGR